MTIAALALLRDVVAAGPEGLSCGPARFAGSAAIAQCEWVAVRALQDAGLVDVRRAGGKYTVTAYPQAALALSAVPL